MKKAFSLVELSIVLVILGLLVGGILAGQSLIRASELRSLSNDIGRYSVAFHAFRDKYFGLPGDITNATDFWGTDPDGCPTHTNRVAKRETCNGDGNDRYDQSASIATEQFRVWQQLANAGLIEGSYTGVEGPITANMDHDAGINCPALKLGNNSGVSAIFYGTVAPGVTDYMFAGSYGNVLQFGVCTSWDCIVGTGFLKPEEAWNIDTKVDDGKPGIGRLVTRTSTAASGGNHGCNSATTSAGTAAQDATYTLEGTAKACAFYYRGHF